MPLPDNPVQFPVDLCPECAFLTFTLLQRLALASGLVAEEMAADEEVQWSEVVAVITEALAVAQELATHHEALDHDPPNDDGDE